jgi:hypothetical protein
MVVDADHLPLGLHCGKILLTLRSALPCGGPVEAGTARDAAEGSGIRRAPVLRVLQAIR